MFMSGNKWVIFAPLESTQRGGWLANRVVENTLIGIQLMQLALNALSACYNRINLNNADGVIMDKIRIKLPVGDQILLFSPPHPCS